MKNWLFHSVLVIFFLSITSCGVKKSMRDLPDISGLNQIDTTRIKHSNTHYSLGNNNLFQNKYGIWELYLEGDALERGVANGSLTRELIHDQEIAFMNKLEQLVPSQGYRNFLKKMIAWFNRKMYLHVPEEYKQEIYGVSRYGLERYDNFAPAYIRMLYFHGAHDIGHALQDLMLVGCTSFAAWNTKTEDQELLIGRNFDFYAGDDFGKQKIVAFINPNSGHKFMMYTWGGMIGSVSGMNEKGITVTINAGKSKMPLVAKTPITLVSREILQYASSISEAIEIAKRREVFVSESIMVGSGTERKAILIEVAPKNFGVYEVENSNQLICSNHFQSKAYKNDIRNQKTIAESHSNYRFKKMTQLVSNSEKLNPEKAVGILRNQSGLEGEKIGYGNEKAINQLLAHHGIVFKPESQKVWISANPYQMGEFVAYDLNDVFAKFENGNVSESASQTELNIPASDFLQTEAYANYEKYRRLEREVLNDLTEKKIIPTEKAERLKELNPDFWEAHFMAGKIYFNKKEFKKAIKNFEYAQSLEITTLSDSEEINKMLKKAHRKL